MPPTTTVKTNTPGAVPTIPTMPVPGASRAAVEAVIATGQAATLPLESINQLQTTNTDLFAGSDMAVPVEMIQWAKEQIAAGQPAEFPAVTNGTGQLRKTGPNSTSKGTRVYAVMFVTAAGVNGDKPFPVLKPREEVTANTTVNIKLSENTAGQWNYTVTL